MRSALILLAAVAAFSLPLAMPAAAFHDDFFECNDGDDNDGDGLIDFPDDPGCSSATSDNESPDCDDGTDNDMDGLVDFPDDPGCLASFDEGEHADHLVCDDGINQADLHLHILVGVLGPPGFDNDNVADYRIDGLGDPGCDDVLDSTETNAGLPCDNGIDDDGDGKWDVGSSHSDPRRDVGCNRDPFNFSEVADCRDGFDNDGDGFIDSYNQPQPCTDYHEQVLGFDCGCPWVAKRYIENPECWDGIDNDGDGLIDNNGDDVLESWEDPGCVAMNTMTRKYVYSRNRSATEAGDDSKVGRSIGTGRVCGLGAFQVLPVLGVYWLLDRRRRSRRIS